MLGFLNSASKLQRGGRKKSGAGGMLGLLFIILLSLLLKAFLVQISWNLVMPRILNENSGLRPQITFGESLMLVILVGNLL